jgi:FKBP-type peptidyl-prolyl cis-trans isomerase
MRSFIHTSLAILLIFAVAGCSKNQADAPAAKSQETARAEQLTSETEKLSYAFGMDIGKSIEEVPTEINRDLFIQGIKDTFDSKETLLSVQEAAEVRQAFMTRLKEEKAQEFAAMAAENLRKGEQFLAENKTKEGVITTESGLQYQVLTEGDGPVPGESDQVTVHYQGTLIDGTEFDSSYQRGEPITMQINGFIAGWIEALQMMKKGSKYRLFIPSELAYGERGAGPLIQPNSTLIFEVELLDVIKSEEQ